jgi:hypothetical protein
VAYARLLLLKLGNMTNFLDPGGGDRRSDRPWRLINDLYHFFTLGSSTNVRMPFTTFLLSKGSLDAGRLRARLPGNTFFDSFSTGDELNSFILFDHDDGS